MIYVAFVFALFGMWAYLQQSSLKKRIEALERQLTGMPGTSYAEERAALVRAAREYIGETVALEQKEDYGDVDVFSYGNTRHGTNTILDVDDDWLLVRIDSPKGSREKLLRMESLASIRRKD